MNDIWSPTCIRDTNTALVRLAASNANQQVSSSI